MKKTVQVLTAKLFKAEGETPGQAYLKAIAGELESEMSTNGKNYTKEESEILTTMIDLLKTFLSSGGTQEQEQEPAPAQNKYEMSRHDFLRNKLATIRK